MKILNLTPNDINVGDKTIRVSGVVARVEMTNEPRFEIDGVPILSRKVDGVTDLPEPQSDKVYIVSKYVADYCSDRDDLLVPDTGHTAERDAQGKIKKISRLIRIKKAG